MVAVRSSSPNLVAQLAGLEVLVRANPIDLEHEARLQLQRVRVALQTVALDALDDLVRCAGTLCKHGLPGVPDRASLGVRKPVQRVQVDRVAAHDSVPLAVALEEALFGKKVELFVEIEQWLECGVLLRHTGCAHRTPFPWPPQHIPWHCRLAEPEAVSNILLSRLSIRFVFL